jgi:hypothetical protein
MTKAKYYTYKVTFKDLPGYFYYGRKKDNGKPYFGSPKTLRHFWDQFEPEIQILQWYETAKESHQAEDALIEHTWKQEWGGNRYSLNRNKGGFIDEEVCRRSGAINGVRNSKSLIEHPNSISSRFQNRPDHKEISSRAGRLSASKNTPAQIEGRREGGKNSIGRLLSQKWVSTIDGYISNARGVSRHNESKGGSSNDKVPLSPEESAFVFLWV